MFSKVTAVFIAVAAPAGVWIAAQPAPAGPETKPAAVEDIGGDLISRAAANEQAAAFLGGPASVTILNHDAELDRLVWRVSDGEQTARIDARTGELVEMAW